ncbi:hypothetical protein ACP70R_003910 [Stipagrostis hirtigluma subsp. patula]
METLTQQTGRSGSPAPSSTAGQRWVMLDCLSNRRAESSATVDGNTMVACRTSTGWPINVSFVFTAAPASSLFYYDWAGVALVVDERFHRPVVIAAHGDSIVLQMMVPQCSTMKRSAIGYSSDVTIDHFLYETGAATGRPPSISMLPACDLPMPFEGGGDPSRGNHRRGMRINDTGVLRHGEDELLIAQLELACDEPSDTADLYVLRVGHEWELKQAVPIVDVNGEGNKGDKTSSRWRGTDAVFPIGDRFLCWVNYNSGFLLCDMATVEGGPKLWRVPLPAEAIIETDDDDDWPRMQQSRSMGAAGHRAVRFVSIDPRCCCGAPGMSTCAQGRFAFTVTTWTLAISTDQPVAMTWVKDNVLDCYDLWVLPSYKGLPRLYLQYPTVSLDNPDIICFVIKDDNFDRYEDWKAWVVEVDMRSKSLLSAIHCSINRSMGSCPLSAKLQW